MVNSNLQAVLRHVRASNFRDILGALDTVFGVLGALVGIIVAITQGLTEPKLYNEAFPRATKLVVTSESKPFIPQQCVISEGLPTEMVHRFDANGEYVARLEPGENRLKVICLERGLQSGSSDKDTKSIA